MNDRLPEQYESLRTRYRQTMESVEQLGRAIRDEGPLDEKTAHLIQLAAAAAVRSEGSVHSHVRRALGAGASPDEVRHALLLLTSTIGFPTVSAAMSWADDLLKE